MRIIINEKYDIAEFNEGVTLDEAIDGIAYKADISLIETKALADIKIKKGDRIQIFDKEFNATNEVNIFKGVVWETKKSEKSKKLSINCKERTVYLEESEDEYQFSENTATQRLKQYCKDWNIPIGSLKVLGKSKDDKSKSPVIGTYKKDTDIYGTLQKIKQDEKITNAKEAKSAVNNMFNTGEETISVKAVKDINTIRAGDKVSLRGQELFVIDVKHDIKNVAKMDLSLGIIPYIRRKFYSE
jgi:hypothetical protein